MAYPKLHDQDHPIIPKTGLTANVNATAAKNQATVGELFYTTDGFVLYCFDGTQVMPVGNIQPTTRVTTTYTILVTDRVVFCNTDSAGFTATLPAGVEGQTFSIKNSGDSGNLLTLAPNGAEHLMGANTNFTLYDNETLIITYNATDGWK